MSGVRVLVLLVALACPGLCAQAGPLREQIAALRAIEPGEEKAAAGTVSDEAGAVSVAADGVIERAIDGATKTGEPARRLADDLRAMFDAALAEDEPDGDALARAYLDASALLAERGDLGSSAEFCREADLWGDSAGLRSRARFNYAQTRFLQAQAEMTGSGNSLVSGSDGGSVSGSGPQGPDVEKVKALLRDAANAFRAVLDVEPGDSEAARNVERVRRMIKTIEDQQRENLDQQQDGEEGEEGEQGDPQNGDQQNGDQEQGDQQNEPQDGEQNEGETESDRIQDWLLEREARQREQRDRQMRAIRGRPVPVERDW